jgi:hypothetical protein
LIDDEDYERVNQHKWCAVPMDQNKKKWYATTNIRIAGKQKHLRLHRFILDLSFKDGKEIDHKDGNGLNNQKYNLRVCSHSNNMKNQKPKGKSKYRGVHWDKQRNFWRVSIQIQNKKTYVGISKSEIQAALMYDLAALKYHKEFARCNLMENLINDSKA